MNTDMKNHSVYLHREKNGFTLRHFVDEGKTPVRYVFRTADELMTFLCNNFFEQGEYKVYRPDNAANEPIPDAEIKFKVVE